MAINTDINLLVPTASLPSGTQVLVAKTSAADSSKRDFALVNPSAFQGAAYQLPAASTGALGGVRVDGTTITIDASNIIHATAQSYTLPTASVSTLGGVKVDGTTITVDASGVARAAQPTPYSLPTATTAVKGGVLVDGTTITITAAGVISSTGGGGSGYMLPAASTATLGGVKVDGTSITIDANNVVHATAQSYSLPTASTTVKGGVLVDGTTISINASGVISASATGPAAATTAPLQAGTATVGTSTAYARADHVHPLPPTDATRAPLASPALTGAPTAPTAAAGTSSTVIATTAFVTTAVSSATGGTAPPPAATTTPLPAGTAAVGTSNAYARADHVHPTDTSRAALASPALTGTPTAPTPAAGNSSTQLATTAFVAGAVQTPSGTIVTAGTTYAMATADRTVVVRKTAASATAVALPTAPTTWQHYVVKDGAGNAGTNNITIAPAGNATGAAAQIDGAANFVIAVDRAAVTLVYDGTTWNVV